MLPARHRLRRAAEFRSTVSGRGAARRAGRYLVVHAAAAPTSAAEPRVGFVVSRAVGGAVVRNRTARRLRAAMAAQLTGIPSGTDVVVRARPAAATASSAELSAELSRLVAETVTRVVRA